VSNIQGLRPREGDIVPIRSNRFRAAVRPGFVVALATLASACAQTDVNVTKSTLSELPKPDRVLVRNFAVTRSEVELDSGLGPSLLREVTGEVQSEDARKVGRAAANALADELVKQLREKGIEAARADRNTPYDATTLMIAGQFVTLDEGNQTLRTVVGFGLGGSEVRTVVKAFQGGRLLAEAETTADSGYKPGAGVTLGAGAAAGTAAVAAGVAAGTTTVSELMMTSVETGSRRTAREIADRIHAAYVNRGWLER
jgi:hypothetical protein